MQSEGGGGAEKPALPVKRSKSMKVVSKPVSVIPVISVRGEPSFSRDEYSEYRYRIQSTKFPSVLRQPLEVSRTQKSSVFTDICP
jgi:hypothetical protein